LAALCPVRAAPRRDRTSRSVNGATISLFEELPNTPLSFTFDNGKEFSKHQELSETLDVPCFFANPYASWERGLNEHTNRSSSLTGWALKAVLPKENRLYQGRSTGA
jgi:IS30 family transposase